jgi:hypothetical protein
MGFLMGILALSVAQPLRAETASREYQIKAVFLFNFLQFVEWPSSVFASDSDPIRIGILGDDPFGSSLDETVQNETIHNRRLVVQRSHRADDLKNCQLIFIAKSENRRLEEILPLLDTRPVLTVGEADSFARCGGIIAFYPEGKKIRFEINSSMALRHGLKMSSQLLGLGRIVGQNDNSGAH